MNVLHQVEVGLGARAYTIHIGRGLLKGAAELLPFTLKGQSCFILTDENAKLHAEALRGALAAAGARADLLAVPAGEKTKSWEFLERVVSWMLDGGAGRDSVLFAVGGGVIGDLGGFAAATFMRGIRFVQVPTTLLAQVDSAVGGKTGINVRQGKNLVGAFYQPVAVLSDLDTLATLPPRELRAGYAEILKYALIDDPEFFVWLEGKGRSVLSLDPAALAHAVGVSCRKKAEIVAEDERESGRRALLNLGHTFGHALEAVAGYDGSLLHGEAVAAGMALAFELSARLALCPVADAHKVSVHLTEMGLSPRVSGLRLHATADQILDCMKHDKKASGGKLTFILTRGVGKAYIARDVAPEDVLHVVQNSMTPDGGNKNSTWG